MNLFTSHRGLALLLGMGLFAWSFMPSSEQLEHTAYGWMAGFMPTVQLPVRTVIITLDQQPEQAGYSHLTLALLLDKLHQNRVSAIGVTLPLNRPQTTLNAAARDQLLAALGKAKFRDFANQLDPDGALERAMGKESHLVLASPRIPDAFVEKQGLVVEYAEDIFQWLLPWMSPPDMVLADQAAPLSVFLSAATSALFPSVVNGKRVAAVPLAVMTNGHYLATFPMLLSAISQGISANKLVVKPGRGLATGDIWYPTDGGLRIFPRLQNQTSAIPRISAKQFLKDKTSFVDLRNRIILIGPEGDLAATLQAPGGVSLSPLEWQAHVVNALLAKSFVSTPFWVNGVQRAGLVVVLCYFLFLPLRLRGRSGLVAGLVLALLISNGSLLLLILKNIWLPLTLPVVFLLAGQLLIWIHYRVSAKYRVLRDERDAASLELASNLKGQGRLDNALECLTGCGNSKEVLEGLYELGLEFERRRQFSKALSVYQRIASTKANYRDIRDRINRHQVSAAPMSLSATTVAAGHAATALVVNDPKVERPVLGRYEIERELGRGAMGTVYLGRDPRIGRTVAIKTLALSEEFESAQLEEVHRRFFQEAETAGRLSHPDIVTIYDVGEEHDLAYIAMDYIQGESLDEYIHPDRLLPLDEVFSIGIKVARALDYAHQQKVVHRDVKPGNIMYDAGSGQLKVTDFGIAHLSDNSKTRTGTVLGSPYYMSPEQISGKKLDGRSDLFSLGVTLYQLFSGYLPFEGDTLTALMYQITSQKPKGIRKLRPELPTCVTRLMNKALEKQAAGRFDTGEAMAIALQRCAEQSGYA